MVNKSKQVGTAQSVRLQSHYVLYILEDCFCKHTEDVMPRKLYKKSEGHK